MDEQCELFKAWKVAYYKHPGDDAPLSDLVPKCVFERNKELQLTSSGQLYFSSLLSVFLLSLLIPAWLKLQLNKDIM
jgi:hypothetical protein